MSIEKAMITLQNKIDKMVKMKETTIAKNYKKTLDGLRITLARMYEDYELNGQLAWEQMSKYNRLQKIDEEVYTMMNGLYKENSKVIKGTLTGIATTTHANTFDIIQDSLKRKLKPISKELDVAKTVNMEMAGLKWTDRLDHGRSNAIYNIQKEIKTGLTSGDTYSTMTKRLKKELETDTYKANRIIRTESSRVFNQTKIDSLDNISKQGVRMKKKWLSGQDSRVRDSHAIMNGVTIPHEDDFVLPSGATCKAPCVGNLPASEVCNCRCLITISVVKE